MSQSSNSSPLDIRAFRASIRFLERQIGSSLAEQTECCAVTVSQCHLLTELDGSGCVNLTELARRMGLDKSTLSRSVDTLVGSGLVDRSIDPENRRSQIICLSVAGQNRVNGIHGMCDAYYQRLLSHIPPEKHRIIAESIDLLANAMAITATEESNACSCQ